MADIADTLKSLLGEGGEEKLKGLISSLSDNSENADLGASLPVSAQLGSSPDMDSIASIMQIKGIADRLASNRNNPSTNLLMSLKPFMRDGRRKSIDSAVKFMGMLNVMQMLGK